MYDRRLADRTPPLIAKGRTWGTSHCCRWLESVLIYRFLADPLAHRRVAPRPPRLLLTRTPSPSDRHEIFYRMAELDSAPKSVQSLYSWYSEGKLNVNRRYQRKLVWTLEEKQKLVESILNRYPVPAILLAEREEGGYEIIDGLQRLYTNRVLHRDGVSNALRIDVRRKPVSNGQGPGR